MSLRCLFGHDWWAIGVHHYYTVDQRLPNTKMRSTVISYRCLRCSKCKVEDLPYSGHLQLHQVRPVDPISAHKEVEKALEKMKEQP